MIPEVFTKAQNHWKTIYFLPNRFLPDRIEKVLIDVYVLDAAMYLAEKHDIQHFEKSFLTYCQSMTGSNKKIYTLLRIATKKLPPAGGSFFISN